MDHPLKFVLRRITDVLCILTAAKSCSSKELVICVPNHVFGISLQWVTYTTIADTTYYFVLTKTTKAFRQAENMENGRNILCKYIS